MNARRPQAAEGEVSQSSFRHNLFWYGLGVWTIAVGSSILATIFSTELGRLENPIGIAIMAAFAAPLVAVMFGAVYAGWIEFRTKSDESRNRLPFALPGVSGLISIPVWVAVIGGVMEMIGFLGEAVNWICFGALFLSVLLLSEISLRVNRFCILRNLRRRKDENEQSSTLVTRQS